MARSYNTREDQQLLGFGDGVNFPSSSPPHSRNWVYELEDLHISEEEQEEEEVELNLSSAAVVDRSPDIPPLDQVPENTRGPAIVGNDRGKTLLRPFGLSVIDPNGQAIDDDGHYRDIYNGYIKSRSERPPREDAEWMDGLVARQGPASLPEMGAAQSEDSEYMNEDMDEDSTIASDAKKGQSTLPTSISATQHDSIQLISAEHTCRTCGKQFSKFWKLKKHIRYHTPGSERKNPCHICGKPWLFAKDLKRHLLKHATRQFSCGQCTDSFKRRDHRDRHRWTKHGIPIPKSSKARSKGPPASQTSPMEYEYPVRASQNQISSLQPADPHFAERPEVSDEMPTLSGDQAALDRDYYTYPPISPMVDAGPTLASQDQIYLDQPVHGPPIAEYPEVGNGEYALLWNQTAPNINQYGFLPWLDQRHNMDDAGQAQLAIPQQPIGLRFGHGPTFGIPGAIEYPPDWPVSPPPSPALR